MARIRSIKPEICASPQVVACSHSARLLFITHWAFCDDRGVHPDSPMRIKMQCFPADSCSVTDVNCWLDELICNGLLVRYQVGGESYLAVTGWKKHQRIEKPTYKWPEPPTSGCAYSMTAHQSSDDCLSSSSRQVSDHSTIPPCPVNDASPPERSGEERSREEDRGGGNALARAQRVNAIMQQVQRSGGNARASAQGIPPEQWALIRMFDEARVSAYGLEQVRPNPAATDSESARRWLKAGAEAGIKPADMMELCTITITAVHQRLKKKGNAPPETLAFHDGDIARALKARITPMPEVETYVQRTDYSRGAKRNAVDTMLAGFGAAAGDRTTRAVSIL